MHCVNARRILTFDSGVGGLGVVRALRRLLPPQTRIDYLADTALFPYGEQPDGLLLERLEMLIGQQIRRSQPEIVVIACNTASTLALDALRARYNVPFVGCVPPVRWAARISHSRVIGILATSATVRRPYLRALQSQFAQDCTLITHGGRGLADLAEAAFLGGPIADQRVEEELDGLFSQPAGALIDAIGLGCTHYTFLADAFQRLSPHSIQWLDPAEAVARQAAIVLDGLAPVHLSSDGRDDQGQFFTTQAPELTLPFTAAIGRFGYGNIAVIPASTTGVPHGGAAPQAARLTV